MFDIFIFPFLLIHELFCLSFVFLNYYIFVFFLTFQLNHRNVCSILKRT